MQRQRMPGATKQVTAKQLAEQKKQLAADAKMSAFMNKMMRGAK